MCLHSPACLDSLKELNPHLDPGYAYGNSTRRSCDPLLSLFSNYENSDTLSEVELTNMNMMLLVALKKSVFSGEQEFLQPIREFKMLLSFTSMFTESHILTVHLFGKQIQLYREHVMLLIEK